MIMFICGAASVIVIEGLIVFVSAVCTAASRAKNDQ
jgi:hypothetical protein